MSVYVGFKIGKAKERKAYISEYYCGGCGWPVSDHDSYCPECGGAFRKKDATERTCKNIATRKDDFACSVCECEVVGCMVDDFGSFDNPLLFAYCPNFGANVVE